MQNYEEEQSLNKISSAIENNEPLWEEPISLSQTKPQEFNCDWLPFPYGAYARAIAESVGVAVDMPAMAILSTMAIASQGTHVDVKADWNEPSNLFTLIVSEPAERKSAVLKLVTKPINEYENIENERLKPEIAKTTTQKNLLIKELKSLEERAAKGEGNKQLVIDKAIELEEFQEVHEKRLLADDVSTEMLISLLSRHEEKMAIVSAEGGIFDTLSGRYTNKPNFDCYLKAYNEEDLRIDRIGRESESLKNPNLCMLLMAQPEILKNVLGDVRFKGTGLTGRFIYIKPESYVGKTQFRTTAIPSRLTNQYSDEIRKLLNNRETERELSLSYDAEKLFEEHYNLMNYRLQGDLSHVQHWAGKQLGRVARIAAILHIAKQEKNPQISQETMQQAISIGNYLIEHAKVVFDDSGADELTQSCIYIISRIRSYGKKEISKRDIFSLCRNKSKGILKANDLDDPIQLLIDYGYLVLKETEQTKGRPSQIFLINPYIYITKMFPKKAIEPNFESEMIL